MLFKWNGFLFHRLRHILDIEGNLSLAQFRGVEGFQVIVVESGMLLGQTERFVSLTVLIDIAEIGFAVETVVALRGEDKPAAV